MSFNFMPTRAPDPRTPAPPPAVLDRRRPRLLLTAARLGLPLYRRDRDLPRLIARLSGLSPLDAITEVEARAEAARRSASATYSYARHIDCLIALLAERRLSP